MLFGAAEESAAGGHMPGDSDLTDRLVSRNIKNKQKQKIMVKVGWQAKLN